MTQQSNNLPVVPRLLSAPLVITRLFKSRFPLFFIFVLLFVAAPPALAQTPEDDDAVLQPAEPDYRVVNLPTTLRLPRYKSNFELTHRFNGNLRRGDFGDQTSNLFGLDEGAVIGFEYRFAPIRHVEFAVYRTAFDKTIQMYSKWDVIHQDRATPVSVSPIVSIEGGNNFRTRYAPSVGATISRQIDDTVAVYAVPMWSNNISALLNQPLNITRNTFFLGIGGRVRIRPALYLSAEVSPRLAGYAPDRAEYGFAIDMRTGSHVFQLNFSNSELSTFAQTASGGLPDSLFFGFNLTRKFF